MTAIRTSLSDHGFVLLRGAIPSSRVAQYRDALDSVYAKQRERPQDFPPEASQGDVWPQDFTRHTSLKIEDLFGDLLPALESALGKCVPYNATFMSVALEQKNSITGLNLHTDGIIQG